MIEYPGRSTTFDGFAGGAGGAHDVVCADTEVTGTEIKTEAAIKAATDTPKLLAFAVMVCSFPTSEIIYGCVATEPYDMAENDHAPRALPVKIPIIAKDIRRSAGNTDLASDLPPQV